MKQTVYVYEIVKSLNSQAKIKMFTQEVLSLRNDQFHNLLGTIELDVEPIKKEVEYVFECKQFESAGFSAKYFNFPVPLGAYDVKVIYKVKE